MDEPSDEQSTLNYERVPSPTNDGQGSMVNKIIRTIKNENANNTTPLLSTPPEEEKEDEKSENVKKVITK